MKEIRQSTGISNASTANFNPFAAPPPTSAPSNPFAAAANPFGSPFSVSTAEPEPKVDALASSVAAVDLSKAAFGKETEEDEEDDDEDEPLDAGKSQSFFPSDPD